MRMKIYKLWEYNMWIDTPIFKQDMDQIICSDFIPWENLNGKTIFITGATGLIGCYLISSLLYKALTDHLQIKILALVRNAANAKQEFVDQLKEVPQGIITFISGSLENLPEITCPIHYIVHAGAPTASRFFMDYPVETLESIGVASMNILRMAKEKHCQGMVYLSSMEVYGGHIIDDKISEDEVQILNSQNLRNCYPIGKCFVENACRAYFSEYGVPVNVLRLSQTIGLSRKQDTRIVSEIAKCIRLKQNIILKTKGESKRTYIYATDVITAILLTLLRSPYGQIYNVANAESYCSIWQLANIAATSYGGGKVQVQIQKSNTPQFPATNYLNLSSRRLEKLGWKAKVNLNQMLEKLLAVK